LITQDINNLFHAHKLYTLNYILYGLNAHMHTHIKMQVYKQVIKPTAFNTGFSSI